MSPMNPSVITAAELAERLNDASDGPNLLVAQVTSPEVYAAGHVPGAT